MSKKKIIGIFLHALHYGGIEKFVETHNKVINPDANECHIVVNREGDPARRAYFESLGYHVHLIPMKSPKRISASACSGYRKLFKSVRFDVVYCNLPTNVLPLHYAVKAGVPRKALHSHSNYLLAIEGKVAPIKAAYVKAMEANASKADVCLACSEEAALVFGRNAARTKIVNNSIDFDTLKFSPEARARVRAQLGIEGGAPLFCHVGRMENDIKNHQFLFEAVKAYRDEFGQVKLVLVGDGKKRSVFEELAAQLGIGGDVFFVGSTDKVSDYLSAADLFLFPSKSEGLGISLVEAQAAGLPCVASDTVPRRAKFTDQVVFAPIDKGTAPWVEAMALQLARGRAEVTDSVVARSGYSVESSSAILREALGLN